MSLSEHRRFRRPCSMRLYPADSVVQQQQHHRQHHLHAMTNFSCFLDVPQPLMYVRIVWTRASLPSLCRDKRHSMPDHWRRRWTAEHHRAENSSALTARLSPSTRSSLHSMCTRFVVELTTLVAGGLLMESVPLLPSSPTSNRYANLDMHHMVLIMLILIFELRHHDPVSLLTSYAELEKNTKKNRAKQYRVSISPRRRPLSSSRLYPCRLSLSLLDADKPSSIVCGVRCLNDPVCSTSLRRRSVVDQLKTTPMAAVLRVDQTLPPHS